MHNGEGGQPLGAAGSGAPDHEVPPTVPRMPGDVDEPGQDQVWAHLLQGLY